MVRNYHLRTRIRFDYLREVLVGEKCSSDEEIKEFCAIGMSCFFNDTRKKNSLNMCRS